MNRFLSASLLATVIFLISCSDDKEPNFPIEPFIESANIRFTEIAGISEPDSLILSFYFRDGDMDLGLDQANTIYLDSPYHVLNYFLEDNGILTRMTTKHKGQRNFLNVLPAQKGKLATARTRNNADFDFLPKYNCADYGYDSLYIKLQDKEIFDETYHYFEKLDNSEGYVLLDTFYVEPNENHFNILIDYLVKQPDGSFVTFDWMHDTV